MLGISQGGCYYVHLAGGQWRMWSDRQPLDQAVEDPALPVAERDVMALVPALRGFALELGLEADKQYRHFVDGPPDRVLTNVVATADGEIEPHRFRFPIVGAFPYKGFFDRDLAEREAASLVDAGYDVCVSAVPAYSTLGWLSDPVTRPMLRYGDGVFAEMALHEWVHATLFVRDDSAFNEGIATFIGQEGAVRFFESRDGAERGARERARIDDDRAVSRVMADTRARVAALYAASEPEDGAVRRALRTQLEAESRARLAALPLRVRDPARVAERARLGDACLALVATYEADLDAYRRVLDGLGGDLGRFVAAARAAADTEAPRSALLAVGRASPRAPRAGDVSGG